jgi:hypothetical protein
MDLCYFNTKDKDDKLFDSNDSSSRIAWTAKMIENQVKIFQERLQNEDANMVYLEIARNRDENYPFRKEKELKRLIEVCGPSFDMDNYVDVCVEINATLTDFEAEHLLNRYLPGRSSSIVRLLSMGIVRFFC